PLRRVWRFPSHRGGRLSRCVSTWAVGSHATNAPSGSSLRRHCPETRWAWWIASRFSLAGVRLPERKPARVGERSRARPVKLPEAERLGDKSNLVSAPGVCGSAIRSHSRVTCPGHYL